jgi:hypothetical protein
LKGAIGMKKANRIMMATVAVLLSLVLLSTSFLSSVYARYVIKKEVDTVVTMEEFGVSLSISLSPELREHIQNVNKDSVKVTLKDSNAIISVENLLMHPGYDFSDAFRFEMDGQATSPVKLSVSMFIGVGKTEYFRIDGDNFVFIPVGLTCGVKQTDGTYDTDYVLEIGNSYTQFSYMKSTFATNLSNKFDLTASGETCYKEFRPTQANPSIPVQLLDQTDNNAVVKDFALGFKWPGELGVNGEPETFAEKTRDELNQLEVKFSEFQATQSLKTITLVYTVSLEQIA